MALLTDELRSWIGREARYPAREELGRASIRYFCLALGDDNPLYLDDDFARSVGYRGAVAPPTLVCETCQYAHRQPNEDGYIGHEWELPVEGFRLIRAGNEYEFFRPLYPEDRIAVTWVLEDIVERPRRGGGSQLFVTSLARYEDASGRCVATNRETIVLQPSASEADG